MRTVLTLPAADALLDDDIAEAPDPAGSALDLLQAAAGALDRRARAGEPAPAAARRLNPGWPPEQVRDIAGELEERREEGRAAPLALYRMAVDHFDAERTGHAVICLGTQYVLAGGAESLLGLAICATRLEDYEAGALLAAESQKLSIDHPRAACIAGICELKLGNRRAAQAHLAAATRLARRRREFRDDQRTAQRLLLILHFAGDGAAREKA